MSTATGIMIAAAVIVVVILDMIMTTMMQKNRKYWGTKNKKNFRSSRLTKYH